MKLLDNVGLPRVEQWLDWVAVIGSALAGAGFAWQWYIGQPTSVWVVVWPLNWFVMYLSDRRNRRTCEKYHGTCKEWEVLFNRTFEDLRGKNREIEELLRRRSTGEDS